MLHWLSKAFKTEQAGTLTCHWLKSRWKFDIAIKLNDSESLTWNLYYRPMELYAIKFTPFCDNKQAHTTVEY